MTTYDAPATRGNPSFSIASIVAIIAAIGSFFVSSGLLTIFLAVSAVVAGLIGVLFALRPDVRGGIVSTIAILLGLLAAVVGLFRGVSNLVSDTEGTVDRRPVPAVVDQTSPAPKPQY